MSVFEKRIKWVEARLLNKADKFEFVNLKKSRICKGNTELRQTETMAEN